jgi:hypothetical protein
MYFFVMSSTTLMEGTFQMIFVTVCTSELRVLILKGQKYSQRLTVKINDFHET